MMTGHNRLIHRLDRVKYIRYPLAGVLAALVLAPSTLLAQIPSGYQFSWGEEFSGTSLDTAKWKSNVPWGGHYHNHAAYLDESQVLLGDGSLNLQAIRQRYPGATDFWRDDFGWLVVDWTSGMVSTYDSLRLDPGCYIEARIKMNDARGSWPAFWMLGNGWPPEIDVMEYPLFTDSVAVDTYSVNSFWGSGSSNFKWVDTNVDLSGDYHVYSLLWDVSGLKYYFDGNLVHTAANQSDFVGMYLILNHAVGGWPGEPDATLWPWGHSEDMLIDWVRVWKPGTTSVTDWDGGGAGSNAQWGDAGNWTGVEPNLGGVTANFDTITETSQTVDIPGRRVASIINLDGSTRYRFGWDNDRLVLGYGDGIQPAINMAATTTTEHEFWCQLEWSGYLGIYNNSPVYPLLLTGEVPGGDGIWIDGPGVVNFDGDNNSYSGETVIDQYSSGSNSGVARVRGRNSLGTGLIRIGPDGNATTARLELENDALIPNPIDFHGRNNNSVGIANNNGSNTISGTVSARSGGDRYWIQSNAGLLSLTAPVAMSSEAGGTRTFTLKGAGDGRVGGIIENGSASTVNMVKDGAGTWTFEGQNSYSGTTTVSNGTLVVNGTTGSGATTVAGGATLAGRGTVRGNLVVQSGATIRIGEGGIPASAHADTSFILLDDFDSYNNYRDPRTAVASGGSWVSVFDGTGNSKIIDSDQGKSLQAAGGPAWRGAKKDLSGTDAAVAVGDLKTIFWQVNIHSDWVTSDWVYDFMMGLAPDVSNIDEFDAWQDFSVMPFINNASATPFINADGASPDAWEAMSPDVWHNLWLVIDNDATAPTFDVYMSTGTDDGTLILQGCDWRNHVPGVDLNAIGFMAAGWDQTTYQIDNIYYTDGEDLSNPLAAGITLEPAAETLTVENDLTLDAGTVLEFDLLDAGIYDRLVVDGNFTANGTLRVALDSGAPALAAGNSFDLFDTGSISGSFTSMELPALDDGLKWNTDSISNGVISVEIDPSVYTGYMLAYGIPGAAFEGDANSNGIPNGMEFYLGWNPTSPPPAPSIFTWTNEYLSVVYPYNASAMGVTGLVIWTTDLLTSNWYSSGVSYGTNTSLGEMEATLEAATNDQLFIRLKVE